MVLKKENWKGERLRNKLIFIPLIILYPFFLIGMELFAENPYILLAIVLVLVFWVMTIMYFSESIKNKILSTRRGTRRLKGDWTKGEMDGEFAWGILYHIPMNDVRDYTKESIALSEFHIMRQEAKNRQLGLITNDHNSDKPLISTKKIEALLSYFQRDQVEMDISDLELQKNYISDKLLEHFYHLETEKEPFKLVENERVYTEEFLVWRDKNAITENILQKAITDELGKLPEKLTKDALKERRIRTIALNLARQFPLKEIESAKIDGSKGAAVQGYLQRYDDAKELIQKEFIFDKAAELAKRFEVPPVYAVVEHVHLKDCFKTLLGLDKEYLFEDEPNLPYDHVVLYSDKPFLDAIKWKDDQLEEIDGYYDIPMNVGKCNVNILARAEHNIPMAHLAHAPGKGYSVKNLEYDKEEIEKEKLEINESRIQDLENEKVMLVHRANKFEKQVFREQQIKEDALTRLELLQDHKTQKIIDDATKAYNRENRQITGGVMTKKKKIFLIVISSLCILACILLFVFLG